MFTDIRKWKVIESLPSKIRPYAYLMRLDRPIGTYLLLFPALWSISLSYLTTESSLSGLGFITLIILFSVGALIMRSAGCIINDIWDRNLDQKVERTRERPLASGVISLKQAVGFLIILLSLGALILLQLNSLTIVLGFVSLVFVIAYPAMKRITWWPQAFLGLTFNFGALMGWTAVTGELSLVPVLLYSGGFFWTLGYDTIYAHQDIEDDVMAGVKSTARIFQEKSKIWVAGFYALCTLLLLSAVILATGKIYSALIAMPAFSILLYQLFSWNLESKPSSLAMFKANALFGGLFLLSCLCL